MDFESLLRGWEGEHAVVRHDAESGAWIFVCVHSTVLGPAGGGTRLRVYPDPADGLMWRRTLNNWARSIRSIVPTSDN